MTKAVYLCKIIFHLQAHSIFTIYPIVAMNWCSDCALLVVKIKVVNPKYGRNAESYRVVKLIRIYK